MSERTVPKLKKWPFLLADLALLGVAWWIVAKNPHPLEVWLQILVVTCVVGACWMAVWPFAEEYRAAVKFAESEGLTTAVMQIANLQYVGEQIRLATGQWQAVQEQAARTVTAAKDVGDRMAAETKGFSESLQKANEGEKTHLRLEVEKLRRAEADWLQIVVNLLDHVYALHQAGLRSGQASLIQQLNNFQNGCRDVARRAGLVAIEAQSGQPYNENLHQPANADEKPPERAVVAESLATGFSYQGQLVRRCLVKLQAPNGPTEEKPKEAAAPMAGEPAAGTGEAELPLGRQSA